jgi:MFS transporter, Spinster family, sphingosine-1-phosphate transporter
MLIYSLLFFCNLLINVDHGTIPASTLHLKTDLGIDNVALGFLGSLVFLGLTFGTSFILVLIVFFIGSLMATPIFSYFQTKFILASSFVLNSLALLIFTVTSEFFLLSLSRFLVGFCQVKISYDKNN